MSAVAVNAVVEGPPDAPVIVMSHSLGMTLDMWQPQAKVLARSFRVVRYDLRGHGRSPVPPGPYEISDLGADIVALLDRLGVARAHLCGLSLGGMASLWLAAHHPARVDRLVVCCTSAQLGPPSFWVERAAAVRAGGAAAVVDVVLARYFTAPWRARHPDRVAELRAAIAATPAAGYVACCGAIERMDLRADLAAIRAPTLAIAGADDPSTPPDHLRRIAGAIAGARVAVVADAAHVANLEQPQVVTDLIEQHLHSGDEDMNKLRKEAGMRVRREVLGDEHVDRAIAKTTPFTADFQDFITQVAWGDVWTRPDLDRRTRSCITLAMLTALGREHEIALHVRGAVRNGVSGREIAEVLIHAAVYAGIPAANRAFQIAEAVLNEIAAENVAPEK